ncbi:hypothetical protein K456DRAFT_45851 [Colletotrichum gloeosporioides 23]|nr:hypothetical protein K456DRAFT_45851 [Colletotrichum gloeosporioides 23]
MRELQPRMRLPSLRGGEKEMTARSRFVTKIEVMHMAHCGTQVLATQVMRSGALFRPAACVTHRVGKSCFACRKAIM